MRGRSDSLLIAALAAASCLLLLASLPRVFGFQSATITNETVAAGYPTNADTPFISCTQFEQPAAQVPKNIPGSGTSYRMLQCTNNLGSDISMTWTVSDDSNNTGVTASGSAAVPAGQQNYCVAVVIDTSNKNVTKKSVVFRATIDQPDLYAEIQFPVQVTVGAGSQPKTC
jgi:hypothetical protein